MIQLTIPRPAAALKALLKADLAILIHNRKAAALSLLVPILLLFTWKDTAAFLGKTYPLSAALNFGLMAIGLMGYPVTVARDRDKGVFQRLRVAPVPSWMIMGSRLIIQLLLIVVLTLLVFVVAHNHNHILLSPRGYVLGSMAAILCGTVYLGLGQLIAALIGNPETVNAVTRIAYAALVFAGMFGEAGGLGPEVQRYIHWSPYGATRMLISAGLEPGTWNTNATQAMLLTLVYAVIFAAIGLKSFKWSSRS